MDTKRLQNQVSVVLDNFQEVLRITKQLDTDWEQLEIDRKLLNQDKNEFGKQKLEIKAEKEILKQQNEKIQADRAEIESAYRAINKQNQDIRLKTSELISLDNEVDKKIKIKDELEEKENILNKKEKDLIKREKLLKQEQSLIGDKRLQYEKIEKDYQLKLNKVNKLLNR